jgi:hypothetical protein
LVVPGHDDSSCTHQHRIRTRFRNKSSEGKIGRMRCAICDAALTENVRKRDLVAATAGSS